MIRFVRLDYRLLHGQVVFNWVGHVGTERIIIIDDFAATDEFQKMALRLAKPVNVKLDIITVAQAERNVKKIEGMNDKIMLIVGNTESALFVAKHFDTVKEINYGALENKTGAKQFGGSVFLTEEEVEDTKEILKLNVGIYIQQTPLDKVSNIKDLI